MHCFDKAKAEERQGEGDEKSNPKYPGFLKRCEARLRNTGENFTTNLIAR